GPLEAEGLVWQEATQTFSILVRRGKGAGQDVRLPLDRPVSRMVGAWLASRGVGDGGRFLWGRGVTRGAIREVFLRRVLGGGDRGRWAADFASCAAAQHCDASAGGWGGDPDGADDDAAPDDRDDGAVSACGCGPDGGGAGAAESSGAEGKEEGKDGGGS